MLDTPILIWGLASILSRGRREAHGRLAGDDFRREGIEFRDVYRDVSEGKLRGRRGCCSRRIVDGARHRGATRWFLSNVDRVVDDVLSKMLGGQGCRLIRMGKGEADGS